jgi:hypothetical protein
MVLCFAKVLAIFFLRWLYAMAQAQNLFRLARNDYFFMFQNFTSFIHCANGVDAVG